MEKSVKELYDKLIAAIRRYRPDTSLQMIEEAFEFAYEAHKEQQRKTGEPYILHPLSVAVILAEIRTDLESIAAGILHDVVEDTAFTMEDITQRFGDDVALLVDGVTKIKKVAYATKPDDSELEKAGEPEGVREKKKTRHGAKTQKNKTDERAENYRKMFFHISQDVRVLLIKIADRLHNMRTLGAMTEEKQREIAQETLDIYAPLAHRLGIAKLRYELEELGFKYTDRKLYDELSSKVAIKQSARQEIVEQIMKEVRTKLEAERINARVEGRPKRFYSIHKKMMSQNKTLGQLFDLYAIRVLVKKVSECYEVLGWLHEMYTPVPGRLKDFIGMKKHNGYQSLHTTLIGPGEPFEVQIRTYDMHSVAEYGIAAHWKYKESDKAAKDKWLQEIMEWQRGMKDNEEFLDALKMDLNAFQEHVYCFTPRGELISLASGSCAIDYAYTIHSAVGNRMIGARVNGKMVPIDHELHTGDQVEIITSNNAKPHRDWLKVVKTNTARTKITQWFNKESRDENLRKGREALEESVREADAAVSLEELLADGREADVLERFHCKVLDQLLILIGVGGLKEKQVANYLYREYEKTLPAPSDEELIQSLLETSEKIEKHKSGSGIIVNGIGDTAVRYARCCGPLPGDEILGFITRGRGLTVHRTDCINLLHMDEFDRRRLIETHWPANKKPENTYHTEMRLNCDDRDGLLADISRVITEEKVKVKTLNARTVQSEAVFYIGMQVQDGEQLEILTKKMRVIPGVCDITRVNA
ncbi:MAG: bifunctional (p)ppGpp synthetase/guanosine-3',5'-bis(diphosphate) 3'-pyrophosphohydrolase [Defluviitaleaceae bacterium]|nr:bifunctional (p)ppGpp synthetase/guanosine-3',5'-bis(diphosphate) 3'-pyrophosphohydrolase [Defluviitaleaceae bacterium]